MKRYRINFDYGRYYFDERADGDWIRFEDHEADVAQLRGTLSLAEEGLANYEDENARLRQRCMAMAFLLYPLENGPREAVEGDI